MIPCPVCGSEDRVDYVYPPYVTCAMCQHTYQPEPPPKTWMNPGEGNSNGYSGSVMNDQEKGANAYIANWLCSRYHPKRTLDIGSGYPYLASRFAANGAEAHALDGGFFEDLISVDGIHDVKTAAVDWEGEEDLPWEGKFDLITMIHLFEHMYNPHEAAKRVFDSLNPEGVLYVRLPNKDVPGIERDHTPGHVKIHPSIYGTASLLRVMQETGFHCIWLEHQPGYGQTSLIFRKRLPKISLFMITKNEEDNIGPCLDSVRSFCDEMIVLDTGSTDRTVLKAIEHGAEVHHSKKFNKDTTYAEFHFAEARNEAMALCDPNSDWLFWMDADDTFEGRILLSPRFDCYNVEVVYGNDRLKHARYFRNRWVPGFQGAIHETPDISGCRTSETHTCRVHHKVGVKPGRIERNTSILETEYSKNPDNLRTVFYLANSYKDAGRNKEAISKYRRYINRGGNFHDELVIAHFYISNCYYSLGNYAEAIRWAFRGLCVDDRHAEFYCRIGESYMALGNYQRAAHYFEMALELPGVPPTVLWTHDMFYDAVPKHQLEVCRLKLGHEAIAVPKDPLAQKKIIELVRPGALGDIIATTPSVAWYREQYPDAWIRYICHPSGYEILARNPDIDEIAPEEGDCSIRKYFEYPMSEGYPDTPMSKHLAEHFADSADVQLPDNWQCKLILPGLDHGFELPEIYITFAVKTGWSEYKEWPLYRWEALIKRMKKLYPEIAWIQLGGPNEPDIEAADRNLNGMTTLTQGFQVLAQSILFVGLDSVFNHACNALEVPAVIMFGSTHPQGSGYPEATNLVANLECQPCYRENNEISVHPKPPCPFDHKCMNQFMTVDKVSEAVQAKLKNIVNVEV